MLCCQYTFRDGAFSASDQRGKVQTDGMRSGFSPVSDRRGILFFYLCPGSGLFHKVFLQSQCVKEGCPADPEYGIILRIEKRKGKEEMTLKCRRIAALLVSCALLLVSLMTADVRAKAGERISAKALKVTLPEISVVR